MKEDRYSDETTTGRILKDPRKATIAARAQDPGGFEWFAAWKRDFFNIPGEVKTGTVLPLIAVNGAARARLHKGIALCPVVVIDFSEYTDRLLEPLRQQNPGLFQNVDPITFLLSSPRLEQLGKDLLQMVRQAKVSASALRRVEWLMARDDLGSFLRKAGLAADVPIESEVFDRQALAELSDREFDVLCGRFAIALGDALSPRAQAEALVGKLRTGPYFDSGHVAFHVLDFSAQHDTTFDTAGSHNVSRALHEAHSAVSSFLESARWDHIRGTLRPGVLKEADSKEVLGIQVADIAAGVASDLFERSCLPTTEAAEQIRRVFNRVFLNGRWLGE